METAAARIPLCANSASSSSTSVVLPQPCAQNDLAGLSQNRLCLPARGIPHQLLVHAVLDLSISITGTHESALQNRIAGQSLGKREVIAAAFAYTGPQSSQAEEQHDTNSMGPPEDLDQA